MVDSHAGMMLTSIEKERFGGSLEASLRCNPGFSIVSINDAPIEQENMRYTFENITAIYNHLLFDNTGYDVKLDKISTATSPLATLPRYIMLS